MNGSNEQRVAAIVTFVPGTDTEKAKRWLEECRRRGIIVTYSAKSYDEAYGAPVLYFP